MLDLETMSHQPNAAIVAIGAVCFDFDTEQLGERFYQTIDLESSVAGGGVMDASTVLWWLKQNEAARQEIIAGIIPIESALEHFSLWIGTNMGNERVIMWGNGAAFDNVILASAYHRHNILQPWDFRNDRCYRTIQGLNPGRTMPKTGTPHNALDDAINQARHLIDLINYDSGIIIY
ncbi:MAG: 3'-5' exonuclease [Methylobacter sp.]